MPPFVSTECPNCKHRNRFDLVELRRINTTVLKSLTFYSTVDENEEFSVTCQGCGQKFKFSVEDGKLGKEE